MTLGVHSFLLALDRAARRQSALWPSLAFAAALALNLLTKGLIGLVFPLGFVALYLLLTRQLRLLPRLSPLPALAAFLAIALPWHILAALRNPAIAMPPGLGLPARAGWAWFYLYNEHVARFLGKRIPQDYGNTPVWLFLLYAVVWMMPWAAFLPGAIARVYRHLGHRFAVTVREREAALTTALWTARRAGLFLHFAPPGILLVCPRCPRSRSCSAVSLAPTTPLDHPLRTAAGATAGCCCRLHSLVAVTCAYFAIAAPKPAPGTDLAALLTPEQGHLQRLARAPVRPERADDGPVPRPARNGRDRHGRAWPGRATCCAGAGKATRRT